MSHIPDCLYASPRKIHSVCNDTLCPRNLYAKTSFRQAVQSGLINSKFEELWIPEQSSITSISSFHDRLNIKIKNPVRKNLGKLITSSFQEYSFITPAHVFSNQVDKTILGRNVSIYSVVNFIKLIYSSIVRINLLTDYPSSGYAHLANIVVEKTNRGHGAGEHAMRMILHSAKLSNTIVTLSPSYDENGRLSLHDDNPEVVMRRQNYRLSLESFYSKLGFQQVEALKNVLNVEVYRKVKVGSMVWFPSKSLGE